MKSPAFAFVMALGIVGSLPHAALAQIPVGARVGTDTTGSAGASGYEAGSRRDPFVSLIQPKRLPSATPPARTAIGLEALAVPDVTVTGIVKSGSLLLAVLQGPDGKSFIAKVEAKLHDGVIKRIDVDGVVFVQQVEDVLGGTHPHEVRKTLRPEGVGR